MTPLTLPDDGLYPMRVAARLTGLSPDLIRAWQRRYGAVEPVRTDGNARRFRAVDVRRLALLKELVEQGHTIKDVAALDEAALASLRRDTTDLAEAPDYPADTRSSTRRLIDAYLGDILIALPFTRRQAAELNRPLAAELRLLTVHGVLHLLGYDHAEEAEEAAMWAKQDAILGHER